ncbi:MAG: hypothetical protein F7C36_04590 [Desulfurococcales archaeon]|nr:hypothetical protein [Desulfurococcales archaeon]
MGDEEGIRIVMVAIGSTDLDLAISVSEMLEKKCYGRVEAFVPVWKEHVSLSGFDIEKGMYNAMQVADQIYEKYRMLVEDYDVVVAGLFEARGFLDNNGSAVLYIDKDRRIILVFTGGLENSDDYIVEEKVLQSVLDGLSRLGMKLGC